MFREHTRESKEVVEIKYLKYGRPIPVEVLREFIGKPWFFAGTVTL